MRVHLGGLFFPCFLNNSYSRRYISTCIVSLILFGNPWGFGVFKGLLLSLLFWFQSLHVKVIGTQHTILLLDTFSRSCWIAYKYLPHISMGSTFVQGLDLY